jgi:hypothetical protein
MATEKNRFSISLDDQTYDIYKRYSQLAGKPMATVIAHMLVEARDHFVQLGVLLQQAHEMVGKSDEAHSQFLARLEMGLHRAKAASDLTYSDLVQTAEREPDSTRQAERPAARRRAKTAPLSLIHRNKSPKSMPTRVPARSAAKKKGVKRAST